MEELKQKIQEAKENDTLEQTLEKIIDQKVEQKLQEKQGKSDRKEKKSEQEEDEEISRRAFLKKAGLGAAGLGVLSLLPSASALNIKDSGGLKAFSGGTKYFDASGDPVQITNADLRLPTGKSIEDGGGTARLTFNGSDNATELKYDDGTSGVRLRTNLIIQNSAGNYSFLAESGNYASAVIARNGEPFHIEDRHGGGSNFTAVKYLTSSSAPGTLELTSANLDTTGNDIRMDGGKIDFEDNDNNKGSLITNLDSLNVSSISSNNGGDPIDVTQSMDIDESNGSYALGLAGNLNINDNIIQTNNFEITENSSTNSLDFNYTG